MGIGQSHPVTVPEPRKTLETETIVNLVYHVIGGKNGRILGNGILNVMIQIKRWSAEALLQFSDFLKTIS